MNTPVVDMHSHVGRQTHYRMHDAPEPYVRIMDLAGVDVAPVSCIFFDTARRCNDAVARFVALNPDRFFRCGPCDAAVSRRGNVRVGASIQAAGVQDAQALPRLSRQAHRRPVLLPQYSSGATRTASSSRATVHSTARATSSPLRSVSSDSRSSSLTSDGCWGIPVTQCQVRYRRSRRRSRHATSGWRPAPHTASTGPSSSWWRVRAQTVYCTGPTCRSWTHVH